MYMHGWKSAYRIVEWIYRKNRIFIFEDDVEDL